MTTTLIRPTKKFLFQVFKVKCKNLSIKSYMIWWWLHLYSIHLTFPNKIWSKIIWILLWDIFLLFILFLIYKFKKWWISFSTKESNMCKIFNFLSENLLLTSKPWSQLCVQIRPWNIFLEGNPGTYLTHALQC